jgi:prevent-host-death family protein
MCRMARTINQRELRNNSGEIMRALDRGEEFIVTRHGVPVGELRPVRRRFVSRQAVAAVMTGAPPIDAERLRADLDSIVDPRIEPRA